MFRPIGLHIGSNYIIHTHHQPWRQSLLARSAVCCDSLGIPTLLNKRADIHSLGVLGCTGSVGQRFILLLQGHPTLALHAVGASSRSAGKKYKDAVRWKQASPMGDVADMVVRECRPAEFADCDVVFSGLDSDVAGDVGAFMR